MPLIGEEDPLAGADWFSTLTGKAPEPALGEGLDQPDWFDRIRTKGPKDYLQQVASKGVSGVGAGAGGILKGVEHAQKSVARGIGGALGVPEDSRAGAALRLATGGLPHALGISIGDAGQKTQDAAAGAIPQVPGLEQSFWASKVPEAVGQTLPMLATAPAGLPGMMLTGGALAGEGAYEEAKIEGASEDDAERAFWVNALLQAPLEAAPLESLIRGAKALKRAGGFDVIKATKQTGIQYGAERATETLQQGIQEINAKISYDPGREWADIRSKMNEAGELGGVAGAFLGGGAAVGAQVLGGKKKAVAPAAPTPEAALESPDWFQTLTAKDPTIRRPADYQGTGAVEADGQPRATTDTGVPQTDQGPPPGFPQTPQVSPVGINLTGTDPRSIAEQEAALQGGGPVQGMDLEGRIADAQMAETRQRQLALEGERMAEFSSVRPPPEAVEAEVARMKAEGISPEQGLAEAIARAKEAVGTRSTPTPPIPPATDAGPTVNWLEVGAEVDRLELAGVNREEATARVREMAKRGEFPSQRPKATAPAVAQPESATLAGTAQPLPALAGEGGAAAASPEAQTPVTFKTSKGSTYVHAEGATTRDKAARPEHADSGPKERSEKTVYVDPEFATEVGMWGTSSAGGKRVVLRGGEVLLVSKNAKGEHGRDRTVKAGSYSETPELGRAPLELWGHDQKVGYRKSHPGNAITEIAPSKPLAPEDPQKAPRATQEEDAALSAFTQISGAQATRVEPKTPDEVWASEFLEQRGQRAVLVEGGAAVPALYRKGVVVLNRKGNVPGGFTREGLVFHELAHALKDSRESDWNALTEDIKRADPEGWAKAGADFARDWQASGMDPAALSPAVGTEEATSRYLEQVAGYLDQAFKDPDSLRRHIEARPGLWRSIVQALLRVFGKGSNAKSLTELRKFARAEYERGIDPKLAATLALKIRESLDTLTQDSATEPIASEETQEAQTAEVGVRTAVHGTGERQGFDVPDETRWRRLYTGLVHDLGRIEQIEEAAPTKVAGGESVKQALALAPGRRYGETEKLRARFLRPLTAQLKRSGVDAIESKPGLPSVSDYLYALHASQANAVAKERHPRKFGAEATPGSGMRDSEAARLVTEANASPQAETYTWLQAWNRKLNVRRLDTLESGGLISKEERTAWEETYGQDYVPLRTAPEDPTTKALGFSAGFGVSGKEAKRREGRKSKADSPLVFGLATAETAIERKERNRVGNLIGDLARKNPGDFWGVFEDANKIPEGWERLSFKENGEQRWIGTSDKALSEAFKRLQSPDPGVLKVLDPVLSYLRRVIIDWNPVFPLTNVPRDIGTATVKGLISGDYKQARLALTKALPAAKGAFRAIRDESAKGHWEDTYRAARKAGALIGWSESFDYHERVKEFEAAVQPETKARAFGRLVEDLNRSTELGTRLATFDALLKEGKSEREAAIGARKVTADFARRGRWAPVYRRLYLFSGANIQGNAEIASTLAKNPRRAAFVLGSLVGAGYGLAVLSMALGDEDELAKLTEDDKARFFGVMVGKRRYGIPAAYGFNVFPYLGWKLAEASFGKAKLGKATADVLSSTLDSFSPLPRGATALQVVTPTVARPFVEIGQNVDFAGRPIEPQEDPFARAPKPHAERSFQGVSPAAKGIAKGLAQATGGDEVSPGMVDISPEWIEHMAKAATGGLGTFFGRSAEVMRKLATGDTEDLRVSDIPFARPFVQEAARGADTRRYYETLGQLEEAQKREKAELSLSKEQRRLIDMESDFKSAEKELRSLRDERDEAVSDAAKKRIEREIRAVQARLVKEASR